MEPLHLTAERRRISRMCFGLAALLIVTVLASLDMLMLAGQVMPSLLQSTDLRNCMSQLTQYMIAFPVAALLVSRVPADPMERHSPDGESLLRCILIICFLLFAGNLLGYFVNEGLSNLLGKDPASLDDLVSSYDSLFLNLLFVVVLAPLWEEILFRKLLIDRLNRLGDRPAMWISALTFGLIHGNFTQFFYAFAVGALLAYLYLRTGKLRYCLFLHMGVNLFFGIIPSYLQDSGHNALVIAWSLLEMGLAIMGFAVLVMSRKRIRLLRGWIELPHFHWGHIAFMNPGMIVLILCCAGMFAANFWFL